MWGLGISVTELVALSTISPRTALKAVIYATAGVKWGTFLSGFASVGGAVS